MSANYYASGSYNVQCPRCSKKVKRFDCQKEWTGQLVCNVCYDPRHPVTRPLPAIKESIGVVDARPRQRTIYVTTPEGLSVWGGSYVGVQGLDPNLTWNNWTETWNGNNLSTSFIIGE